ncbi:MAG: hypothetical protein GY841_05590 [FCB group bacterium]|nr:hypothetical protein [FCB group bacterium]
MSFSLHFTIDAESDRNVMNVKIYDVWKKQTAVDYHQEFKSEAEPLMGRKWAKIINVTNWKATYPDAMSILGKHMRWSQQNGNVLAIYITDKPISKNNLKKMFHIGGTGKISRFARSREDAEKLLRDFGF